MWHLDAEIIALVFMTVIAIDVSKTLDDVSLKDKLFNVLSVVTILTIIVDIFSSIAMMVYTDVSWWTLQGSLVLYFILTPVLSLLWFLYAIAIVFGVATPKKRYFGIAIIPFIVYLIVLILNPFTGWVFELSSINQYSRGIFFNFTYVIFYGYNFLTLIIAVINYRKLERTTSVVLLMFPIISGLGVYIQQLFPGYLVTGSAFVLVILITYMFLQNRKMTRDNLTGLYNRVAFSITTDRLTKTNDFGFVVAVAIDDFKLFNQTFGQVNGDILLKHMGEYLVSISPDNTCYRYGGDIFALILKRKSREKTLKVVDTIMDKFSESFYMGDVGHSVSVSLGVVQYPHLAQAENDSIITALDFAIYQAKKCGKGQIAFFDKDLMMQVQRKYQVMDAITKAMETHSFEVYLQPIYDVELNNFRFAEALLRLTDDNIGSISPAEFIPITEETGQIIEITYFVLEEVCAFIKNNRNILRDSVAISVNFSVIQFMQNDMVDRVKAIVHRYGIPPHLVKIEITESVIADCFDDIKSSMVQLNEFGISFALDDYGQGYSNISYLINLPFTFVKMDKSIIDNIQTDKRFISALIPMLKHLDKVLVAEGVESKEQSDMLRDLACDTIQGFYFAKPMPFKQSLEFFEKVG